MLKRFFIVTKQNSLSESYLRDVGIELNALTSDVTWVTPWESTGVRFARLGEVEEFLYSELKDKLSVYYNVYEDIQFEVMEKK